MAISEIEALQSLAATRPNDMAIKGMLFEAMERHGLITASSPHVGPDYSQLGERGIRGVFRDALEMQLGQGWARRVGFYFDSDAATETHRWLGQIPALREWLGNRTIRTQRVESFAISNVEYEGTVDVPLRDLQRDKTGQLRLKSSRALAARTNQHWDKIATTLISSTNPLCYDGQNLYDTDHSSGLSGTLANALTVAHIPALNIGDTGQGPTKAEAIKIINGVTQYFFSYLDDAGEPANGDAKDFVFVVPWLWRNAFRSAMNDELNAQGGTSELAAQGEMFSCYAEPRLAGNTVGYCFRADAEMAAAIILQEEIDPEFAYLDEGSEFARLNKKVRFMVDCSRAAGAGQWRHTIKFTVS